MRSLAVNELSYVAAGSILGVLTYGTIGFWVGGFTGFCMGIYPTVPGAILGMTLGAYLGTDGSPTIVIVKASEIDETYVAKNNQYLKY